ncbi:MAG: FAD-dependent oxidoreductase [Armatimonadetes bacterium]|nr:FAD-dependent oxidoreductase [Armatimonadota bacterium]
MSETTHDCVIIGGGIAGCTAGMYAKRYSLEVCVLDSMGGGGGNTALASLIENYPGFPGGISGVELAMRVKQQAEEVGVPFMAGTADRIVREGDLWRVAGGDCSALTRTVILAMGAFPRSLQVPGEVDLRGKGVSYCATCDGFFYRGKTVAVVGGGNSAVDEACYLASLAQKVYLIHRRDELRAESYMQQRAFATSNLEIIWDTVVTRVLGEDAVTGVELRNVKTGAVSELPLDGLFVAIGHIAKTEWLEGLLEMEDGFIKTDAMMATNQPGIFACGDIRVTPLRQITTAVGDATLAAYAAYQYVLAHRQ